MLEVVLSQGIVLLNAALVAKARIVVLPVQEARRKEAKVLEVVSLSSKVRAAVVADGATRAETANTKVVVASQK